MWHISVRQGNEIASVGVASDWDMSRWIIHEGEVWFRHRGSGSNRCLIYGSLKGLQAEANRGLTSANCKTNFAQYDSAGHKHASKNSQAWSKIWRSKFRTSVMNAVRITTVGNQNLIQEEIKRRLNSSNACYHSVQKLLSFRLLSKNVKLEYTEL
jgi:hypothetical protein